MTNLSWSIARASGIVTWAMLAASVLWGLALSTKAMGRSVRANWLLDLHRFLGAAGLVFCGIHVGALVADNYVDIGLSQILVPFTSSYRATAVTWGVVALYLLAAVEITSLLRNRMPKRVWRSVHLASFGAYVLATAHGFTAGTDAANGLLRFAYGAVSGVVLVLTALRIVQAVERSRTQAATPAGSTRNARARAGLASTPTSAPATSPATLPITPLVPSSPLAAFPPAPPVAPVPVGASTRSTDR